MLCAVPTVNSDQVIKGGKTKTGQQRYKCHNADCPRYSFQRTLIYKGRSPEIKEQVVDMSLNGSGIRDTARVLKISPTTVISELKKNLVTTLRQRTPVDHHAPRRDRGRHPTGRRSGSG